MLRDWQIGERSIGYRVVELIPMKRVRLFLQRRPLASHLVFAACESLLGIDADRIAPKHIVAHLHRPWLSGEEIESVRPLFKVDGSWAKALEDKEISTWMEQ